MKKAIIFILAAASVFASCNRKEIGPSDGYGALSVSVSGSGEMNDQNIDVKSSGEPDVETFEVLIKKQTGEEVASYTLGDMPELLEMIPGNYIISVTSPDRAPVAWEQPVYGAEKEFSIVRDNISNIDMVCTVQNAKVSVRCTEKFLAEVTDYSIVVTTDDGSLTWNEAEVSEGRSGYFTAAPMTVYIKGYRAINPEEVAELDFKIKDVSPRDHIILNVDAKTTGDAQFSITVDGSLNDRVVDIEVPGFPETPVPGGDTDPEPGEDAPSLDWPANPDFDVTPLEKEMDVRLTINAPAGISELKVGVESKVLNGIIGDELDLVNPGENEAILSGVGLPVGDEVTGRTELPLDLSALVPLIIEVGSPETLPGDHSFTLKVRDAKGQTLEQTLVFRYTAE